MQERQTNVNEIFTLISELTSIPGPTGQEEAVKQWLRNKWKARMLEWQEDAIGNICCKVGGIGPKVIIQSHMDEIGFVVRYITPRGFLLLDSSQEQRRSSPERRYMIGHTAQIIGRYGTVIAEGIFAAASGHVLTQEQIDKPHLGFNDFFIDIGTKSREEAEKLGVYIGAGVIWYREAKRLGSRIVGKALDDRMLLIIMDLLLDRIEIAKIKCELWFGATVQEENGRHGANALSFNQNFDKAIVLDVGLVGDTPTTTEEEHMAHLGGGPTLVHKDGGTHYNENLLWCLVDIAEKHGYPYQHGVYSNYNSDGAAFMSHHIPSLLIGVPTRYTHTPFEVVETDDIETTVKLLQAYLEEGEL